MLLDHEYLDELKRANPTLMKYLTAEKLLELADLVIQEPKFNDNPERCFKLPFLACETLSTAVPVTENGLFGISAEGKAQYSRPVLLDRIVSFYTMPDPQLHHNARFLNPTLGGYVNKILTFWLARRPKDLVRYIIKKRDLVQSIFNHLYLTDCVTDLLVNLCTLQSL